MRYVTIEHWDEALWKLAEVIYEEAFPEHGRKKRSLIRSMLERGLCFLHVALDGESAAAMAITGRLEQLNALLIDYIAVREALRGQGLGQDFMAHLRRWASEEERLDGIVIEIEAEPSPENLKRLRFWENCGFRPTAYVHRYIWVPEPYRALILPLRPEIRLPEDGETLFRSITAFHKRAYSGK
ncbi:GNAT family N-acetyltransferase [Paenibacillus filicis]|uniref:GNAT family N-acetyltransferase n=1 Tax=Paenibacillus gyeongsangnamensis TaxID=3388067 RepID=A0ABT4QKK1_9BACL|nr:GNAT family N-acetyltransferase [Paenibacillus filicis]MCZ8517391.1 GNAT family N-acetyltransferase [Paenibacillus filicis]